MKLQPSRLILLVIALSLGGTVYFLEHRTPSQSNRAEPIFTFNENQVQSLTIKTRQQTLIFSRAEKPSQPQQQSQWLMKTPLQSPASEASVAYLLNLLVSARSDRQLSASVSQRQEFGLDNPLATVTVKLINEEAHQLVLGKPDFNHSFLYAQADPSTLQADLKILLVPTTFENAVNRPLSEWQHSAARKPTTIDPD